MPEKPEPVPLGMTRPDIIRRSKVVIPVKLYPRPEFNQPLTLEDQLRQHRFQIADLKSQIKSQRDKIYRMEMMLQSELKMWRRGMNDGEWETPDMVKRRISRIQGAIDYKGRADSPSIDTGAE